MTFYESIANQGRRTEAVRTFIETSGECAMYFDKEGVYKVSKRYQLANHLACKAGVFCCAIDLDFRLTESWGESKMIQYNKMPALRL